MFEITWLNKQSRWTRERGTTDMTNKMNVDELDRSLDLA